jgi:iron complex outermembrane receptor protein
MHYLKSVLLASTVTFFAPHSFAEDKAVMLSPVIVTANPLNRSSDQLTQAITLLEGKDLHRKLQPTIGETLAGEPGIRSTYFGPGASRPVIRGLGGDQINILQNGINNMDASNNSADHNLAIDPLSVERIEVIRGPSALLYGSKAVGGVVNIIDNRIPDQPIPEKVTGATDFKYNSVNNERSGSILLEGGAGNYAWHINGFKRVTDDIEIPGYVRSKNLRLKDPHGPGEAEERGRINNSQSDSKGFSIGLSRFFDKGYFGASFTNYETNYGIAGHEDHAGSEPDITIGMKQRRFDLAGLYKDPFENIKSIKYKFGFSNYEHTEFEGLETGTIFENSGYDSRVELTHNKLGLFEGAFGLQSNRSDFSATGEEAFIPSSTTQTNSAFILEEVPLGDLKLQIGGRLDYQEINVDKSASFANVESRNDLAGSASLGFVYNLPKDYSVALSTSYTQRAPNAQELYSDGDHVATETFEIGNQELEVQKSVGIDLSLRKDSEFFKGEVNLFYNNFQNFITLSDSGAQDPISLSPIYNYVNMPAEFYGAEIKALFDVYDKNKHQLDFEIRADYVEARNSKTSEHLPRISPARVGGSAIYNYQKVGLRLDADYTFTQNNVASSEIPTNGYIMLNARTDYQIDLGSTSSTLYFNATNLLDQEARNHVSFLKDSIPLAGRSFMIGVKTLF